MFSTTPSHEGAPVHFVRYAKRGPSRTLVSAALRLGSNYPAIAGPHDAGNRCLVLSEGDRLTITAAFRAAGVFALDAAWQSAIIFV